MSGSLPYPIRALAVALLATACSSGGTTDPPPTTINLLVVGMVRNHITPRPQSQLEGGMAFFYDRNAEEFLEGAISIVASERPACTGDCPLSWALDDFFEVGVTEGAIYHKAPQIRPGDRWRIVGTVFGPDTTIQIESSEEIVPQEFQVAVPATTGANEPLLVEWEDVPDAEEFTVAAGSGYEVELPAGTTSHMIPAGAFSDVASGVEIEITVTAFNNFYVSIATGISSLDDAEEISERFLQRDNVEGANGTFGASTSISTFVTIE